MRPALCTLVLIATVATVLLPTIAEAAPAAITVHDYTSLDAPQWTGILMATIDEFNAVRPDGAPELRYVADTGELDCLDIPGWAIDREGELFLLQSRPVTVLARAERPEGKSAMDLVMKTFGAGS